MNNQPSRPDKAKFNPLYTGRPISRILFGVVIVAAIALGIWVASHRLDNLNEKFEATEIYQAIVVKGDFECSPHPKFARYECRSSRYRISFDVYIGDARRMAGLAKSSLRDGCGFITDDKTFHIKIGHFSAGLSIKGHSTLTANISLQTLKYELNQRGLDNLRVVGITNRRTC